MCKMSKQKKDRVQLVLETLVYSRNTASLNEKRTYSIDILKLIMDNINYKADLNGIFMKQSYCMLIKIDADRECPCASCEECCKNGKMYDKIIELYNKKGFDL